MTTILDALYNAEVNLSIPFAAVQRVGLQQLKNAIKLLEKGYPSHFVMNDFLDTYDNLENAPTYTEYLEKSNA